jgi:type I restriction enzyme S subunit
MNAELLLAHYDGISDAPDAVARLRKFILDLAVRGKLVEQAPQDEPATVLLRRIQKQKNRMAEMGEIRKQETLPVEIDDEPFSIPTNWAWTRLGQIADWGSGSTPSRGNHEFFGGGVTWLKSGELNDNKQLIGSEETVTEQAITKGSFRQNRPGDVLIAMYGATIGKVAILAESAVTNQAVCGCTLVYRTFFFSIISFLKETSFTRPVKAVHNQISRRLRFWDSHFRFHHWLSNNASSPKSMN